MFDVHGDSPGRRMMNNNCRKDMRTQGFFDIGSKSNKSLPAPVMYTTVLHPDTCYAHSAGIGRNLDRKIGRNDRAKDSLNIFSERLSSIGPSSETDLCQTNGILTNERCDPNDTVQDSPKRKLSAKSSESTQPDPTALSEFAQNSTLHGISHVFKDGKWTLKRGVWMLSFFSSLSLFLLQANNRYSYYRTNPHVTKLDELGVSSMKFPAITICNVNLFRLSKISTKDFFTLGPSMFMLFDESYNLLNQSYKQRAEYKALQDRIQPILNQGEDYDIGNRPFEMFEFYNRTGPNLTEMILRCSFQGESCLSLEKWKVIYTRYGKCYTFNSGELSLALNTSKGGVDNGIELLMNVQQDEYMPVWAENDETTLEAGFKVQIHHQSEPPFIHELGFGVAPGFQTLVATQEQRITFLPEPWGDCVKKGNNMQTPFYYDDYSISACRLSCETDYIIKQCRCKMIHMIGNDSVPYCSPELYRNCADKYLDFLMEQDSSFCNCRTPCEVTRYNLETSMLAMPSTRARSYLAAKYGYSEEYVKNNFLKLNIFFEALNYETIDQKVAYEVAGLLGDIGGQMGLFIGASILTILELLDYIYEFLKDKCGKGIRKRRERDEQRARIGPFSALLGKPKKTEVEMATSPDDQFPQVPGTMAMTSFPQQHGMHNYNGGMTQRQNVPFYAQPPQCMNQSRSMPYSSMPYKSAGPEYVDNDDMRQPLRQTVEPLPPPPPQYLGQSMMTLRVDCGMPDHPSRKYDYGVKRRRETSLSYNDLLHLENGDTVVDIEGDGDYQRRPRNPYTTSGITTLPHFRATTNGFTPVTANEGYHQDYRFDYADDGTPHHTSPSKIAYPKTLETDIM